MSIITISTPFNIDLTFRAAPFHRRVSAWFIDFAILCTFNYLLMRFVISPVDDYYGAGRETAIILYILLAATPSFLYHLLMEQFLNGQSLGKRAMKMKVISLDAQEPTFGQYMLRWVLGLGNYVLFSMPFVMLYSPFSVIFLLIFYLPDVLSIALTSRGLRLGDLAAGTVLIDTRHEAALGDTIYLEIEEDNYVPVFPEVMKLTDRDINGIRNLLDVRKRNRDSDAYMAQIAYRIREVLQIQTNLLPEELLRQLLKDYNHITRK